MVLLTPALVLLQVAAAFPPGAPSGAAVSGTVRDGTAGHPHQGATVNISGSGFLCPGHGARFAADGHWVGGQPTSNLRSLSAAYDSASGTLTIT